MSELELSGLCIECYKRSTCKVEYLYPDCFKEDPRLYFDWVEEWLEFCNTRKCPDCALYPCHGDFPIHVGAWEEFG